jgi:DNA-binding SARP family transcriptional activator
LEAIEDLEENLSNLKQMQSLVLETECHLALGLLYHDQGEAEKAKIHLHQGLDLARRRRYGHFVILSPRDTARACLLSQEYLETGNPAAEYGMELLARKYGQLAGEELAAMSDHPHPRVSQTVRTLQRCLHRAGKLVLTIGTLGGLRLAIGKQTMSDLVWDRRQPKRLLAAILSLGPERVHKEVLIEALWPDEKPGQGENNFKITLQRLRKTLEADLSPRFGSSYIHLHNNLVFLDEELCRVDFNRFAALAGEGREKEKRGKVSEALDCFAQAAALYQGDFIPEERYAPWAERRREELKGLFLDILLRSARLNEQKGSFKKAAGCLREAIQADPLLEEAYRSLMSLYAGKKMFNEALRVFESCKKSLKDGLDTPPDPVTVALYQGIREQQKKS